MLDSLHDLPLLRLLIDPAVPSYNGVDVVGDTEEVSGILDQSHYRYFGGQDDGVHLPSLAAAGISGKPAFQFDGSKFFEFNNTPALDFERSDPFTVFSVVRFSSMPGVAQLIIGREDGSTQDRRGWNLAVSGYGYLSFVCRHTYDDAGKMRVDGGTAIVADTNYIIAARKRATTAASGVSLWLNGVPETLTAPCDGLSGTMRNDGHVLMGAIYSGTVGLHGVIGPTVVYGYDLSDADVLDVCGYLNRAYPSY